MGSLYRKKELSTKGDGSSFFQNTQIECTRQAVTYLTIREHNRKELALKLKTKGYSSDVIESTLDALEDNGSLSEVRYVQSFVRSNNRRHPEGKGLVAQRLAAKGADRNVARKTLDEIYSSEYTAEMVQKARLGILKKGKAQSEEEVRACLMKLGFSGSDLRGEN